MDKIEPKWLSEKRHQAQVAFDSLPYPKWEEYWRHTPMDRFHLKQFTPLPIPHNGVTSPTPLSTSGEILYGEKTSKVTLNLDAKEKGVFLGPLSEALQKKEELVHTYFGQGLKNRSEKFLSQNEACWQTGVFCAIPQNVKIEAPFFIAHAFSKEKSSLFPRLVIVLGKGAQATIIHTSTSEAKEEPNFINSVAEIYLEEGSSLCFIDLQNLSKQTFEVALKRLELGPSSNLTYIAATSGAKLSKINVETVLKGEGANAQIFGLVCAKGKQHLELFSNTEHRAPNTKANILVKGVVKDRAKTVFQGMIRIEKEAQKTESFMQNNNLLLSPEAHADSIPRLEIEADDVKASHGATVGEVDAEQLFYLKSRGFTEEAASHLLVEGFYEDILGRIPFEAIREVLRKNLSI